MSAKTTTTRPRVRLRAALAERKLSPRHAQDLLAAFKLDVTKLRYRDWDDLIGYCSLSAMPVGRFVLDVHGESRSTWPANDALCAALQIINHLQDCKDDYRNLDRVYVPLDALAAHGIGVEALGAPRASPALLAACTALRAHRALLARATSFRCLINDRRLALEVSVINTLAHRLTRLLMARDPLSERVHLSVPAVAGLTLAGIVSGAIRRLGRRVSRHDAKAAGCVSDQAHSGGRARLRQLVLYRHAHPAARAARGDVRNLFVLPRRRRYRRRSRPARRTPRAAGAVARRHRRALSRRAAAGARRAGAGGARHSTCSARTSSPSSTAWRWTSIADIRAPDRPTLDLYCDRVACAVGRLSVRVFGMERDAGIALAHHLGRALQLTNILRDLDEDAALGRLYLPREALQAAGHRRDRSGRRCWRIRRSAKPARRSSRWPRPSFAQPSAIMAESPRRVVRAPRIMGEAYRIILEKLIARGFAPPREPVRLPRAKLLFIVLRNLI